MLLQTKISLVMLGIKKDNAVSKHKESMNKSSAKNVFLKF